MRKLLLAAGVATIGMLTAVMPAAAWWNWCEEDPMVVITTPGHATATVYVTIQAVGISDPSLLQSAAVTYTAHATQNPAAPTAVHLRVSLPELATSYRSRVIVSSQPMGGGTVYRMTDGFVASHHVEVEFGLPVR